MKWNNKRNRKENDMRVIRNEANISLDKLKNQLVNETGILVWICSSTPPIWRFLKGPHSPTLDGNKYTYGWTTFYYHRGQDNSNMFDNDLEVKTAGRATIKHLIKFISRRMTEGDQFYWFATEYDLLKWMEDKKDE